VLALLVSACPLGIEISSDPVPSVPPLGKFQAMACNLPKRELVRIWNGYYPERSGEIQVVPKAPNYQTAGGLTHSGPWDYLQQIPMLWFGPGQIPARGRVDRPATMADVAPTIAGLLGYPFDAPDGEPLREALLPNAEREEPPPRLILIIVWDGAGRNVLREHPDAWPTVRNLIEEGVWFDRFTDGSSPSVTPAIHTTLGTGAFPRTHGLVDQWLEVDGRKVPSHDHGPQYLRTPALADLYDRDMKNRPKVGMVAYTPWHLGMIGQGSFLEGGDRDLAALMDRKTGRWTLTGGNEPFFEFPEYINEVPGLDEAIARTDRADGQLDGAWLGEPVLDDVNTLMKSPAYAEWQTTILEEIIAREEFGADDIPDLLFTNYKMIDEVGHRWTMNSPQMGSVVRASDEAIARLIDVLDRDVGRGRWVLALTADHGVTPDPSLTGAFAISKQELEDDIEREFGGNVVTGIRPTELWIDTELLEENGYRLEHVAHYIARYTKGQNLEDPGKLEPRERKERLYAAAFPGPVLEQLPCLARPE